MLMSLSRFHRDMSRFRNWASDKNDKRTIPCKRLLSELIFSIEKAKFRTATRTSLRSLPEHIYKSQIQSKMADSSDTGEKMILHEYRTEGYEEYNDLITKLKLTMDKMIMFFCGSLNEDGNSWCSDCRHAIPVVYAAVGDLRSQIYTSDRVDNFAFVFVSIDKEDWKGDSKFRTDETLNLTNIPTLIRWENGQEVERLGEQECKDGEKVMPFFDF